MRMSILLMLVLTSFCACHRDRDTISPQANTVKQYTRKMEGKRRWHGWREEHRYTPSGLDTIIVTQIIDFITIFIINDSTIGLTTSDSGRDYARGKDLKFNSSSDSTVAITFHNSRSTPGAGTAYADIKYFYKGDSISLHNSYMYTQYTAVYYHLYTP